MAFTKDSWEIHKSKIYHRDSQQFHCRKTFDGLLAPGGFADQSMQVGIPGLLNIIRREFANWKITEQGNLLKDLQMRGVDDMDALPGYHYRDDALLLWHAMDKYITTVINKVYGMLHMTADGTICILISEN